MTRINRSLAAVVFLVSVSTLTLAQSASPGVAPATATESTAASATTPATASAAVPAPKGVSVTTFALEPAPSRTTAAVPAKAKEDIAEIAPPVHPATAAQIRQFLILTKSVEKAHDEMRLYFKTMRASASPDLPPAFWDDMENSALNIDIVGPSITAFQKYYSQEDMAAAIAFFRSPAGRRIVAAQPFVSSIISEALHKAGEEAGVKVGIKYREDIKKIDPTAPFDVVITSN